MKSLASRGVQTVRPHASPPKQRGVEVTGKPGSTVEVLKHPDHMMLDGVEMQPASCRYFLDYSILTLLNFRP